MLYFYVVNSPSRTHSFFVLFSIHPPFIFMYIHVFLHTLGIPSCYCVPYCKYYVPPSSRITHLSVNSTSPASINILHNFINLIPCFLYITAQLDICYPDLFSLEYSRYFHTLPTIVYISPYFLRFLFETVKFGTGEVKKNL
jgi:hypothetical protein